MLKDPTVRTFVCWIGTMFLLTVFVLAFSPLHTSVCGNEYQAAHQQCPTYNVIVAALMYIGRNSDIVAAIITALATVTIANFTVKLVEVTNRQAALSKDALIVGNAAFVFVQDIKWVWITAPDDPNGNIKAYAFRPIWANSGGTQTENMMTMVACEYRDSELPPDFDFTLSPTTRFPALIGPKSAILGGSAREITVAEMEEVAAKRKFLYLWGYATYNDVFSETSTHITRYCIQVNAGGDLRARPQPGKTGPIIEFPIHPRGNCADAECVVQGLAIPAQT